jgi:uncharacterized protein YgfB (UPF0149 family)
MTGTNTDWDHFDGLLGRPLSELHGMATGSLAAVALPEAAFETLVRMLDLDEAMIEASALAAFVAAVNDDLFAEDLGFTLLLPDDEAPLVARLEELANWCAGFVAGFTYAEDATALPDDVAEALGDLRQISDVDPDSLEGDEFDFFAVAEHARVAALLIQSRGEDDDDDE